MLILFIRVFAFFAVYPTRTTLLKIKVTLGIATINITNTLSTIFVTNIVDTSKWSAHKINRDDFSLNTEFRIFVFT